jgi:phosphoglycolate phosphatase
MKNLYLIFDFDGTVADTFNLILKISNMLADDFKFKKIQPHDVAFLKDHTLEEVIQHLKVPVIKIPLILAKSRRELYKEIVSIKPIPGLAAVLENFKVLAIPMGIMTTNSNKNVLKFLHHNQLEVFDFVYSSSKIFGKNFALKKLSLRKRIPIKEMVYIGDETREIAAAKRAGVRTIAVCWGYNSEKALLKQKPDFVVKEPQELEKLIQTLL